jgi:peptidoglycan/LPS O-acetylase OafA/YrhL
MRWALAFFGLLFVIFGGCVLAVGASVDTGTEPGFFAIVYALGAAVLILGAWLCRKAFARRRPPDADAPGSDPP